MRLHFTATRAAYFLIASADEAHMPVQTPGIRFDRGDLISQTAEIVAAYLSHNSLSLADITKSLAEVYRARCALSGSPAAVSVKRLKPAVSINKSITPDFIVCLEDGKKFKSLKGHLRGLGLTPDEYRAKWGLRSDYPVVAPNYSKTGSSLAKTNGLVRKPGTERPAKRTVV